MENDKVVVFSSAISFGDVNSSRKSIYLELTVNISDTSKNERKLLFKYEYILLIIHLVYILIHLVYIAAQSAFTCSNLKIETLEQRVKYVQS